MWCWQAHYRQRNREIWHLSPRHTTVVSPVLSDPAMNLASSREALWTAITVLSALSTSLSLPYSHPAEDYLSVGGWARQGAPAWSMALCQSLDRFCQLILTTTI